MKSILVASLHLLLVSQPVDSTFEEVDVVGVLLRRLHITLVIFTATVAVCWFIFLCWTTKAAQMLRYLAVLCSYAPRVQTKRKQDGDEDSPYYHASVEAVAENGAHGELW